MEEQSEQDDFSQLPRHTWVLFPRLLTINSLSAFAATHSKFRPYCDQEIDRYHGNAFFSFIFKIPENEIPLIFERLTRIINHYFKRNITSQECLISCESFLRRNDQIALCLQFQNQLMPSEKISEKWGRQNGFVGDLNTVFLNNKQISILLSLLAFRCASQSSVFSRNIADECIVILKDNQEKERLIQSFLNCITELSSENTPPSQTACNL